MTFELDQPIIFVIVGIILALVIVQSTQSLIRAKRRAKELGVSGTVIKKTIIGAAVFSIAPSIAIVLGVITLSKALGLAFPWFRLSVVGSLTYESSAFGMAIEALNKATGSSLTTNTTITDVQDFITIAFVMTSGILSGPLLVPFVTEKFNKGMLDIGMKDKKWGELLNTALFMGLISAFLGMVFTHMSDLFSAEQVVNWGTVKDPDLHTKFECLIAPLAMLTSSVTIAVLGLLSKKPKLKWLLDYALPFSMIVGMAVAIPLTMWLAA